MELQRADLELRADGGYSPKLSLEAEIKGVPRCSESGVWRLAGAVLTLTPSGEVNMSCRVATSMLECRQKADEPATIFRRVD